MDRIFRLLARFAALLLVLLPIASPAEDARGLGATPPPVRPALWKVADKDTTIYLFGTVHVLPPGIPWYDGKVAAAFEGSQELVTEIVDTDPTKKTMMQWASLSGNETLRGMLSPPEKEVDRARRIIDALKVAESQGKGAASLDGKMIDAASERMARNVLATHEAIATGR